MNKLVLIDGSNIMYRSFHSPYFKELENGGIKGFIHTLRHVFRELKPTHIVVCGDSPVNLRKDNLPTYKGHRKPPEEDLLRQLRLIPELSEALGIHYLEVYGYEADDLFGTLSHLADIEQSYITYIISNDKDANQCLSDSTKVVNFSNEGNPYFFTHEMMYDKYKVHHYQFVDYLAIVGDVADGFAGARKVGSKGAISLLGEFDTLEGIFRNIDKIKSKSQQKSFRDNESEIRQSRELAQIVKTVPINKELEEFRYTTINRPKYEEFFGKLNMVDMIK